ncbi:MAG: UDP-3-O-[3-hydroxymyristoyl] glucosamine N-acyltransferase, partial [Cyanobacteriota bacterium]
MKFSHLVDCLQAQIMAHSLELRGDHNPDITGVAALEEATLAQLSYVENAKYAAQLPHCQAGALILPLDETVQAQAESLGIAWMATANPRLLFAQAIALFYQPFRPQPGIHPTAVIDPSVQLGQDVAIGPHVVIYPNCQLGDRVCVLGNVVIYPDVSLGHDTLLHANCTIHERAQIGPHCVIHSGAVIGAEGFGF